MLHNSDQMGEQKPTATKGLFVLGREKAHKSPIPHVNFAFFLPVLWMDPRLLQRIVSYYIMISPKEGLSLNLFIQQQNQSDWLGFQCAVAIRGYIWLWNIHIRSLVALFQVSLYRHRVSDIDLYNMLSNKQKRFEIPIYKISDTLYLLVRYLKKRLVGQFSW